MGMVVTTVAVETTDAGPFAEDVFFVLNGGAGVCRVPQGAAVPTSCSPASRNCRDSITNP